MGLLLPSILLLSVFTLTAGLDFQQGSKPGQSVFVKHSYIEEKAAKIVKRSLPSWLAASSAQHRIKRRSTEQGDSCKTLQGYDTKLADNTHSVSYQLSSCYSSHV